MRPRKTAPNIFLYSNYRTFLRDLFSYHRARNRHFTCRYVSQKAGLASPSALKEVIDAKKNLTSGSLLKFAIAFNLTKTETEYLQNLVLFNQSGSEEEKNKHYREVLKLQQVKKSATLGAHQYEYYSNWYNAAIRELAALPGFKNSPDWIAEHLVPSIKPSEAKKSIELLLRLGLLKQHEDTTLSQQTPKLEVDPDLSTLAIRNFNRSMADLGKEAIERFTQDEREVSGCTIGVSSECAQEIKEMVREFKKKVLNFAVNDSRPADAVYQMNVQFFPVARQAVGA